MTRWAYRKASPGGMVHLVPLPLRWRKHGGHQQSVCGVIPTARAHRHTGRWIVPEPVEVGCRRCFPGPLNMDAWDPEPFSAKTLRERHPDLSNLGAMATGQTAS